MAGKILLSQFTHSLGADGMPQEGVEDYGLDLGGSLQGRHRVPVSDDELAQGVPLELSGIM